MRAIVKNSILVLGASLPLVAFAINCGGSSSNNPVADGGGGGTDAPADVTRKDAAPGADGGADGGPAPCTMTGSLDLAVHVAVYPASPLQGAAVRAENAAGECSEAMTGADGIAHVKVDPAKGPFDVTAAAENLPTDGGGTVNYAAVSILGVTQALQGTIQLSPTSAAAGNFPSSSIAGSVLNAPEFALDAGVAADGGKRAYKAQIDAWDFSTVVCPGSGSQESCSLADGGATYKSIYSYDPNNFIDIPLAAILVDPDGNATKGVYTTPQKRTGSPMHVDVDFGTSGLAPIVTHMTIQFPSGGAIAGSTIKELGQPAAGNMFIGNSIVVKTTTQENGAEQFVGIGNVTLPQNGASTFTLQTFPPPMAPDIAEAILGSMDYFVDVQPHTLTDNSTITVGTVNALTAAGMSLADLKFSSDADPSYEWTAVTIGAPAQMNSVVVYWNVYAQGGKIASRGLPHLPNGIAFSDLSGGATLNVALSVSKLRSGAPPIWGSVRSDIELQAGQWVNRGLSGVASDGR